MAKKMKKDEVVDIFSVLAEGDEPEEGAEEGKDAKKGADDALLGKIGAMEAELAALRRTNTALMAQNGGYTAPAGGSLAPQKEVEADFSGLPDPVTAPEEYQKEVAKRISAQIRAQQEQENAARAAQQDAQASRDAQVNALWSDFEEKYPDLAAHRDIVEVVAVSVANKAKAKGIDVQRYMFAASDQYIEDVAAEMKKKYGKALEVMGKGEEGDEHQDGDDGSTMSEALMAARTRGISGGLPTSGKATKGAGDEPAPRDDLISDLQKVQRSMGII